MGFIKIINVKRYYGALFFAIGYDNVYGLMRTQLLKLSATSLFVTVLTNVDDHITTWFPDGTFSNTNIIKYNQDTSYDIVNIPETFFVLIYVK